MAKRKGTAMTSVALAYVMDKAPYVFPIVGGRKVEHLKGNIEALKLALDQSDIDEIEAALPFDAGFPLSFTGTGPEQNYMLQMAGEFDYVQHPQPIKPPQK